MKIPKIECLNLLGLEDEEYVSLLEIASMETMVMTLKTIKKYASNPILNGRAPVDKRNAFVVKAFLQDYRNNHRYSLYKHLAANLAIMLFVEHFEEDVYERLIRNELEDDEVLDVMNTIIDDGRLSPMLIRKIFTIQHEGYLELIEKKINKYVEDENHDQLENDYLNLKKEYDKLKEVEGQYIQLKQELKNMGNVLKKKDKEIELLKKERNQYSLQELVNLVMKRVKVSEYKVIEALFGELSLNGFVLEEAMEQVDVLKRKCLLGKDYSRMKDLLFLEYILVNTKEIENNG